VPGNQAKSDAMPSATPPPLRIVALLCLVEVLSMTGFSLYPAFLPMLRETWQLSGAQAGFVGGAFFFGYMLAVPFLSGITDRIDARSVLAVSCLIAFLGTSGFALFAQGAITAALFQALTGAGLAGTYMPGLKALTDRVHGLRQPRYIAFYTSTFGIGTSVSLAMAGWLGALMSWRYAFALLALGPLLAALILLAGVRRQPPEGAHQRYWWPRFGPVWAQREVRRFILGYSLHCWELFGLRSWMVAFIVFAFAASGTHPSLVGATGAAALINLLGLPASILGNEAAGRVGRTRWIAVVMTCSGTLCWLAGFSATWPWWVMLTLLAIYFLSVMGDSAALTAGLVAATPSSQRGAAMAMYSLLGFGAGFVSPMVFGAALDAARGGPLGWGIAFATLGTGGIAWAITARKAVRGS
jgi:MFS family permease